MKRMKKIKIKQDMPETSTFRLKDNEEHDLAYYIHDRVELMHQVFSVIKAKDLKTMIPQCVKNISLDDLQELCTEELLGISSKRLCAILDGAEPPSDTESSSSSAEQMETISLDSISSDEEILSQNCSKNKKHKHKKRKKHKIQEPEKTKESSGEEKNRASRAGLTVLELLELQARARAIRAQLQKDQSLNKAPEAAESAAGESEDEVEIKEEPAEVVEISSEDEKPNAERLKAHLLAISPEKITEQENPKTVTKRINDLVITVPQTKQTRKIKLKRNKVVSCEKPRASCHVSPERKMDSNQNSSSNETIKAKDPKKNKSKKKEKNKQKMNKKDGSDHDEITLQLSDTEKMDLLEDLDRKNYDSVSSSSDSSGDSSDSDNGVCKKTTSHKDLQGRKEKENKLLTMDITISTDENTIDTDKAETNTINTVNSNEIIITDEETINCNDLKHSNENSENIDPVLNQDDEKPEETSQDTKDTDKLTDDISISESVSKNLDNSTESADVNAEEHELDCKKRKLSEGEILDRYSPVVEGIDISDIRRRLSVSDDDKHKNKKDKISKKKSKRSNKEITDIEIESKNNTNIKISPFKDHDVNEIYELSDDSSCYEVEGVSVLSKEPTTVEIEALSAKVDDTIREDISDDVKEYNQLESEHGSAENVSWKDRYLDSKKVKRVLKTSSILNAIRKKNRDLKKKLEESKMITPVVVEKEPVEGTTDEYNTLEGSNKYVDPVSEKEEVKEVTKEMEKDAKQLLKMYKKLLKYNDMHKKKDPYRKKVKKSKKKKQKHKEKESPHAAASSDA